MNQNVVGSNTSLRTLKWPFFAAHLTAAISLVVQVGFRSPSLISERVCGRKAVYIHPSISGVRFRARDYAGGGSSVGFCDNLVTGNTPIFGEMVKYFSVSHGLTLLITQHP